MFNIRSVAGVVGLVGGGRGSVCVWLLSFCFAGIACAQCCAVLMWQQLLFLAFPVCSSGGCAS